MLPVDGIGEVVAGADLAGELLEAVGRGGLRDGDVVVVTSKVVSKAEGRTRRTDKASALAEETVRVLARRGATSIVRTRLGLVMAGAGIDASNTEAGTVLLLPEDPDASARALREDLAARTGCNVAVVLTDTAGRAWRQGQTDLAVGVAGLAVLHDYAGRVDPQGNRLEVTAPAVVDEVAAAADLVKGKLTRRPAALVRGLAGWVLPAGEHGAGARALTRPEGEDMFGLGAREAAVAALVGDPSGQAAFGRPAAAEEVVATLRSVGADASVAGAGVDVPVPDLALRPLGAWEARVRAAAYALGWRPVPGDDPGTALRFAAATP